MAGEIATYFPGLQTPPLITWGPRRRRKRQRAIRLGSYDPRLSLIRIHRRLDDAQVPGWLVGFVIYHELLHHVLGVGLPAPGIRRPLHSAEFRRREAQHRRYAEAMAWEATVLPRLLAQQD
ncbi:MAG: hypothetical protein CSA24_02710 [Deltaproteobacteria bacterium]|nr:MAG: hypothetical protein CSA24_02710 [Deltaproteobacteria bacterium]